MSTPSERNPEVAQGAPKRETLWKVALAGMATLLGIEVLLRLAGIPVPAWVLVATGAVLAFLFILPAIGGRMDEPESSPFKKAPWGF
jgi:hypothetical protein